MYPLKNKKESDYSIAEVYFLNLDLNNLKRKEWHLVTQNK